MGLSFIKRTKDSFGLSLNGLNEQTF